MQRIIVASDSHGRDDILKMIVSYEELQSKNNIYILAGDSESDPESIYPFVSVKGNMDSYPFLPFLVIPTLKHQILVTHGHLYNNYNLLYKMEEEKCDICILGHSHKYKNEIIDNNYFLNPGSCARPRGEDDRCYMRIDVCDNGKLLISKMSVDKIIEG